MPVPQRRTRPLRPNDPREIAGHPLRGRLGEGGQGTVFLGETPDGREVAVKLLHARFDHDPEARRYFTRELAALRRVAPFCTARVLAADPDADPPYVVSEYVDGPSLQEAVHERGVLAGAELDRLAVATATALGAIHAAGVVHRDFKPANVLLAADGPRVIDFGIARPFDATAGPASGVVGTPSYMSPEQLSGHPAGPELDLFAWACTIAYAANGRPPFGHEPLPAVINRILNAEPDLGRLADPLRHYVAACLHKDPARRPTAAQLLMSLMNRGTDPAGTPLPMGRPVPVPPPAPAGTPAPGVTPGTWEAVGPSTRPGRARRGLVVGAVAGTVAVLAGVAVVLANLAGAQDPTTTVTTSASASASASASTSPSASAGNVVARSPRLGLEFWQNGAAAPLTLTDLDDPVTKVTLQAAPFELRVPTLAKDRAVQVCAWTDDSIFEVTDGAKTADHPCFAPGTGMADYEHGSGTLFLNNQGHNYLIGDRVAHHSDAQDKVLFSAIFKDGAQIPVSDQRDDLYLTVFIDHDGDQTFKQASEGEYEFLVLDFPG